MRTGLQLALSFSVCFLFMPWTTVQPALSRSETSLHETLAGKQSLVSWQNWTTDLFARAQKEKKLVILDLEAIWCHWCHVMDQKTYSDPAIAKVLQDHYIAVKVDQDSRPDLSNRYEQYGWPATIVFAPDGRELAKRSGFIRPDEMLSMLKGFVKKPVPEDSASAGANDKIKFSTEASLSTALRDELSKKHVEGFDAVEGGFGRGSKFLDWDSVEYALAAGKDGNTAESEMAKKTLNGQLNLIDPVWGGVYQYSTDGDWKHPHFEKIMEIQGENLRIFSLSYSYFKDPKYLDAAKSTAKYLHDFLRSPDGAFYTSQDADLKQGEHSGEYFTLSDAERRKQGIPRIDKHIYARENGWAINGLVSLYMATGDKQYLQEAEEASNWVIKNRAIAGGGFRHDESDAAGPYLGDTLNMGRAFLTLYFATGDRQYLRRAEESAQFIDKNFKDSATAGYLSAAISSKTGAVTSMPHLDENIKLARFSNMLFQCTGKKEYKDMSELSMRYLSTPEIARTRKYLVAGLLLADRELSAQPAHITIVGGKSDPAALALFQAANKYPTSYKRVEWYDPKEGPMPNPDTEYPEMPKAAAFACANQRCSLPVYTPDGIAASVEKMMKSQ